MHILVDYNVVDISRLIPENYVSMFNSKIKQGDQIFDLDAGTFVMVSSATFKKYSWNFKYHIRRYKKIETQLYNSSISPNMNRYAIDDRELVFPFDHNYYLYLGHGNYLAGDIIIYPDASYEVCTAVGYLSGVSIFRNVGSFIQTEIESELYKIGTDPVLNKPSLEKIHRLLKGIKYFI